jgi:glutamate-1-semialdehyde 2,1-aminomutase
MSSNIDLDAALVDTEQRYIAANPKSAARHREAAASLPGGNTRAVLFYKPFPLTMVRGDGCRLWDLDGHDYTDFVSEYGAGLYGHSDPIIRAAIVEALQSGWVLGAPNLYEARLAAALVERFLAFDRLRFCNSGTEANLMALGTARVVTGRSKILAFREGYHGGVITFAHGGSELNVPFDFIFADYNDIEGATAAIRTHSADLAAVIVEPMMGGGGCIPATRDFLAALRSESEQAGALLIFDEVITSRLAPGGLHGELGIRPDLMTMGKYLGGGCSFGVFGGRANIMERFDPNAPNAFSHGGTFNNNVLSMAAGFAGLTKVLTPEASRRMNSLGDGLRDGLNETFARHDLQGSVTGVGSVMNVHFVAGPVTTPAPLDRQDKRLFQLLQLEMALRGQYVTGRGMLALSLPFGQGEIDRFVEAFDDFLRQHHSVLPKVNRKGESA